MPANPRLGLKEGGGDPGGLCKDARKSVSPSDGISLPCSSQPQGQGARASGSPSSPTGQWVWAWRRPRGGSPDWLLLHNMEQRQLVCVCVCVCVHAHPCLYLGEQGLTQWDQGPNSGTWEIEPRARQPPGNSFHHANHRNVNQMGEGWGEGSGGRDREGPKTSIIPIHPEVWVSSISTSDWRQLPKSTIHSPTGSLPGAPGPCWIYI